MELGARYRSTDAFIVPSPVGKALPDRTLSPPACQASAVSPRGGSAAQVTVQAEGLRILDGAAGGPSGLHLAYWVVLWWWRAEVASGRLGRSHSSSQVSRRIGRCVGTGSGPCLLSFSQGSWEHCLPDLNIISDSWSQRWFPQHRPARPCP